MLKLKYKYILGNNGLKTASPIRPYYSNIEWYLATYCVDSRATVLPFLCYSRNVHWEHRQYDGYWCPGAWLHQVINSHMWYQLCAMGLFLPSLEINFTNLRLLSVKEWYEISKYFYVFSGKNARHRVNILHIFPMRQCHRQVFILLCGAWHIAGQGQRRAIA